MAFSRRKFLLGVGGAVVGLPFLEGLVPKEARADAGPPPFALFYRRGNGVQQAIWDKNDILASNAGNREPERWWPSFGPGPVTNASLTAATTSALSELGPYGDRIGIVKGLRHLYGQENAHPEGAAQGLTGGGVKYPGDDARSVSNGGTGVDLTKNYNAVAMGESLDNRIARELSRKPDGSSDYYESLYMGVKTKNEASVSWKKNGGLVTSLSPEENLLNVYNDLFLPLAGDQATRELLYARRKSVNDLVRADLISLRNDKRLSSLDRDRLNIHMEAIRDTENALVGCVVPGTLLGDVSNYDINSITAKVDVIGKLAALAIACGARRSVLINVGEVLDQTKYPEVSVTAGQYEFHAVSHRLASENGSALAGSQDLHHAIDRYHLQRFKSILDLLSAYDVGGGQTLVDRGTCVHYSDIGSGQHIVTLLPYLYVGGANGALNTGIYVNEDKEKVVRFLNTIGAAVGCKNDAGKALDDFNADTTNWAPRNYCWHYYDVPQPPKPSNAAKPMITGRLTSLVKA